MLDISQFRILIIRDTLVKSGYWSQSAENLLLGTAMIESKLSYFEQLGGGPAKGLYQCEKATYVSVTDYIKRDAARTKVILAISQLSDFPPIDTLIYNLRYATLICRMHYYRFPQPLPEATDYVEMAHAHKILYNTAGGKTEIEDSINVFKLACKES